MRDDEPQPPATPNGGHQPHHISESTAALLASLEKRLLAEEKRFVTGARAVAEREEARLPAWLRPTKGEHRYQMGLAVLAAIGLQLSLPVDLTVQPHYVLPIVEGAILIGLFVASPGRIVRHSTKLHVTVLALLALLSADNAISAGLLVHDIVRGTATSGPSLLLQGAAIWLTNVIAFGLWYWEFDRGGPVARAGGVRPHADLLFPQMQQPDVASADWEPTFFDYLYTSFTNATAFSPTDTMPLSRWAKVLFLTQSAISLITVALVISRAVNIFGGASGG
jgi:hypothetical protein